MRLYSFTNMYTAGIHAGIQTAHLVHEMAYYDGYTKGQSEVLRSWAKHHKTIIVLQAGYHQNILNIYKQLSPIAYATSLPVGYFRESVEALAGAWTATGIVVPKEVYDPVIEEGFPSDTHVPPHWKELHRIIKSYPLAK